MLGKFATLREGPSYGAAEEGDSDLSSIFSSEESDGESGEEGETNARPEVCARACGWPV